MKKRSIEAETTTTAAPSLSENVNLFQSLRVLQEGEPDENRNAANFTSMLAEALVAQI